MTLQCSRSSSFLIYIVIILSLLFYTALLYCKYPPQTFFFFYLEQPHIGFIDDGNKYTDSGEKRGDQWFGALSSCECCLYLSQGQTQRPQHLDRSVRFFSACLMSWLIWSMPSSTRFSCSETHTRGQTSMCQTLLPESHYIIFQQFVELLILFCLLPVVIHFLE